MYRRYVMPVRKHGRKSADRFDDMGEGRLAAEALLILWSLEPADKSDQHGHTSFARAYDKWGRMCRAMQEEQLRKWVRRETPFTEEPVVQSPLEAVHPSQFK